MKNPFHYNQLPHPNDRASRAAEVIAYTLRFKRNTLFDSFRAGTDKTYTFGVIFEGDQQPHVIDSQQLGIEISPDGLVSRVYALIEDPAAIEYDQASSQRPLTPDEFTIIPAPSLLRTSKVQ